mmetsp:Transcript_11727/g.36420  ORF Transcript_11727/g.36420 Transcript_11727/m.36420 type:complete len:438 (+) Transcript_11727:187-1500(+)
MRPCRTQRSTGPFATVGSAMSNAAEETKASHARRGDSWATCAWRFAAAEGVPAGVALDVVGDDSGSYRWASPAGAPRTPASFVQRSHSSSTSAARAFTSATRFVVAESSLALLSSALALLKAAAPAWRPSMMHWSIALAVVAATASWCSSTKSWRRKQRWAIRRFALLRAASLYARFAASTMSESSGLPLASVVGGSESQSSTFGIESGRRPRTFFGPVPMAALPDSETIMDCAAEKMCPSASMRSSMSTMSTMRQWTKALCASSVSGVAWTEPSKADTNMFPCVTASRSTDLASVDTARDSCSCCSWVLPPPPPPPLPRAVLDRDDRAIGDGWWLVVGVDRRRNAGAKAPVPRAVLLRGESPGAARGSGTPASSIVVSTSSTKARMRRACRARSRRASSRFAGSAWYAPVSTSCDSARPCPIHATVRTAAGSVYNT